MLKQSNRSLFLLYISILLLITFLQQEYIFLPELNDIDIISDELRSQVLEKYQRIRWLEFFLPPLIVTIRLCLVSLCLAVGGFFFAAMSGQKYKTWWDISMKAQSVIIAYNIFLCIINISFNSHSHSISKCTSLLFLASDSIDQWLKLPLSAINLFEIAYWFVIAVLVKKSVGTKFGHSFKFVMSTYGVGYLFYIILLMFLILYLGTNA